MGESNFTVAVLGAGMMGRAAAFDLASHGGAGRVRLLDLDSRAAGEATTQLARLLGREVCEPGAVDASDPEALTEALRGCDAVLSCLPYFLNLGAARAALAAGCHFTDLGGNTGVVRQELQLDAEARTAGLSVVPDCGLAPGLVNVLAAAGIRRLAACDRVYIRCGGLPQQPRPPLGYAIVFSVAGLINEYCGEALCLRGGQLTHVPTLTEAEPVQFEGFGPLEAFVTSGGSSLAPEVFAGRVLEYDYKTIRYPGHLEQIRTLAALGLFGEEPLAVDGALVVPRRVFATLAEPRLTDPELRDLVLYRVSCEGALADTVEPGRIVFELVDRYDEATGFSAMQRTTAFAAAAVTAMQAAGAVPAGAATPERALDPEAYLAELGRRGLAPSVRIERRHDLVVGR